jgi:methylase of polypeptide subunit release factors
VKRFIYTCIRSASNAELFAKAARLYLQPGQRILDMSYGNGTFWRKLNMRRYTLIANDLDPKRGTVHHDFRDIPLPASSFNHTVFDPPYMHHAKTLLLRGVYNNQITTASLDHNGIVEMYRAGMREALRLTRRGGLIWVKCQDEVESGIQRMLSFQVQLIAMSLSLATVDAFILHQARPPVMRQKTQKHARKNHSTLFLFRVGCEPNAEMRLNRRLALNIAVENGNDVV